MNPSNSTGAIERLLREIKSEVRQTASYTGRESLKPEVYEAMRQVNREDFVRDQDRELAWGNYPLSIGEGQTISQPYIVALMTDMLEVDRDSVVLEIGAGSGYQAAVLSLLVKQVISIEIIPQLAQQAQQFLQNLGYNKVAVKCGNGRLGWPQQAPYDAIIVTAASEDIPPELIRQLKPGGRLVIPIGGQWMAQQLMEISKDEEGKVIEKSVLPVSFVPLTGG
ncbi:MAG TPA: protein-L-isoaspartate O-methyltransferase [Gammaproteobacteria bacterium]|nr:protein-L-isoaspartate O-methyltransferase [Gammaproteobacteria bacterium]